MCLLKKGIQVADILQAMVEVIQVDVEALTKEEAINIQAQTIVTVDTSIKLHDNNTAANSGFCNIGAEAIPISIGSLFGCGSGRSFSI
jgi:hypothetical protein